MSEPASSPPIPSADGDTPITSAELRALLTRARATDDGALRRLVTSYVTLRRATADVIDSIEAREGGAAVARNPLLHRARSLVGVLSRDSNLSSSRGGP